LLRLIEDLWHGDWDSMTRLLRFDDIPFWRWKLFCIIATLSRDKTCYLFSIRYNLLVFCNCLGLIEVRLRQKDSFYICNVVPSSAHMLAPQKIPGTSSSCSWKHLVFTTFCELTGWSSQSDLLFGIVDIAV
jgi:hypothetical protein